MAEEKPINWLAIIAPALVGSVVGTCLGFGLGYMVGIQPDFALSVQPLILVTPAPSDVMANVIVKDLYPLHKYQNQIVLMANVMNDSGVPDMRITFDPVGFDPLISEGSTYNSIINISLGRSVNHGLYRIRVMAIGGDGKEKSCIVFLKVIAAA